MLNLTVLTGRLVEEPELRSTKGDNISVTSFRLAVKRDYAKKDETDFFDVVAWRATAEFICQYFRKGSLIQLSGRLQNRSWQDKHNQNRVTTEIVAEKAYFGDSKDKAPGDANYQDDFDPFGDSGQYAAGGNPANGFDPFAG